MRRLYLLAIIATLTGAAPGIADNRKQEAADKGLGMALMSVSYSGSGAIYHSTGVSSVTFNTTGAYIIEFERSLDGCEFVAGASNFISTDYAAYSVRARRISDTGILVSTALVSSGNLTNRPVNVIVFCSE